MITNHFAVVNPLVEIMVIILFDSVPALPLCRKRIACKPYNNRQCIEQKGFGVIFHSVQVCVQHCKYKNKIPSAAKK